MGQNTETNSGKAVTGKKHRFVFLKILLILLGVIGLMIGSVLVCRHIAKNRLDAIAVRYPFQFTNESDFIA